MPVQLLLTRTVNCNSSYRCCAVELGLEVWRWCTAQARLELAQTWRCFVVGTRDVQRSVNGAYEAAP